MVGSTEEVKIGNKMAKARQYPWGVVQGALPTAQASSQNLPEKARSQLQEFPVKPGLCGLGRDVEGVGGEVTPASPVALGRAGRRREETLNNCLEEREHRTRPGLQ